MVGIEFCKFNSVFEAINISPGLISKYDLVSYTLDTLGFLNWVFKIVFLFLVGVSFFKVQY